MASILDPHIDDIIQSIESGDTLRSIAKKYKVAYGTLTTFLAVHSARAKEAYRISAQSMADKAIEVLKDKKSSTGDVMRDRELASHYRWEAKMRDRAKYGDKVEVENTAPNFTQDNFNQLLEIARANASVSGKGE